MCPYVDAGSQASGFPDALDDEQLLSKPDCVVKVLSVIASALQSQTNTASTIHLLNTIRTSALLTQHLIPFFTRMPAEHSMQRQRTFRRAIKARNNCIHCKSYTPSGHFPIFTKLSVVPTPLPPPILVIRSAVFIP